MDPARIRSGFTPSTHYVPCTPTRLVQHHPTQPARLRTCPAGRCFNNEIEASKSEAWELLRVGCCACRTGCLKDWGSDIASVGLSCVKVRVETTGVGGDAAVIRAVQESCLPALRSLAVVNSTMSTDAPSTGPHASHRIIR